MGERYDELLRDLDAYQKPYTRKIKIPLDLGARAAAAIRDQAQRIEELEAHVAWLADGARELQFLTHTGADRSVLIATAERVLGDFEGEQ